MTTRNERCPDCFNEPINTLEGQEMYSIGISIDVPNLAEGIKFYSEALGFERKSEPYPGVVVMAAGAINVCLLEKKEGSVPSARTTETRRYARHWTPVHLDIHVPDLEVALARAVAAGATAEQVFKSPEHGSAAFCGDPFGHGFCLIERKA